MSEPKREPWDELVKSVLGVIEIDQMEIDRLRKERDEWADRYFKQADRIDSIGLTISRMEDDGIMMGKAVSTVAAATIANLVLIGVVIASLWCYGK